MAMQDIEYPQANCGILRFAFLKNNSPAGRGVFYAFKPANISGK
jgi:hypothetical protein